VSEAQPSGHQGREAPGRHQERRPEAGKGTSLVTGDDGRARCWWGASSPEYVAYHDEEWGRPVRGDDALYERLVLEAFQSGLSWITILRKRENFRAAFGGFAIDTVAEYGDAEVQRLMADAGIVRNRAKIEATIANARATVDLRDAGTSLPELVWSHRPAARPAPRSFADVPAQTPEAVALAKALKKAGFRFVGPTTLYAGMQACGLVNDHVATCPSRAHFEALQAALNR
jgi:DNA-3-methyladenine glycosylase I